MNSTNETYDGKVVTDSDTLLTRLFIGYTCNTIVSFIIFGSVLTSIHRAPSFVIVLVMLIGLSNIAGICFSNSLFQESIFSSIGTFVMQ